MKDTLTATPPIAATRKLSIGVETRSVLLLGCLCFALFFWHLGKVPFYGRGEPREGLVVQEMASSSEWILPVVNGSYIPFKPPFFHWTALLSATALGRIDEFTLRLPSAAFATLGVFLVYFAGRWLWEERVGVAAAVVLLTNYEWWSAASLVQVDMTLAFFITAALLLFFLAYRKAHESIGRASAMAGAALLACATLAKGPIGVLIPVLVFFCFLALRRKLNLIKKFHPVASAAVFGLLAGSWYLLAIREGGYAFVLRQIVDENLRTAGGTYGHYQSPFFYLGAWIMNMLPWSLFLPGMAVFAYRRREWLRDERVQYFLVWFLTVLIVFSLARGKRSIYILPLYPAAALLFGAWWVEFSQDERAAAFARWETFILGAGCLAVTGAFVPRLFGRDIVGAMHSSGAPDSSFSIALRALQSPSAFLWSCLALIALAGIVMLLAAVKHRWHFVFTSVAVAAFAMLLSVKALYFPALAGAKTVKPFMQRVRSVVDKDRSALYTYRSFDYQAVFYAARHVPEYPADAPFPKPPFFLLMWENEWERLPRTEALRALDASENPGVNKRQHIVLVRVDEPAPFLQGSRDRAGDAEDE